MGQYHKVFNLTKKEFLNPHAFGDGLKLMEFGSSGDGTMQGLAILLAVSNGRGGGDCGSEHSLADAIIGRWGGDRIAIIGDYSDVDDLPADLGNAKEIYANSECQTNGWVDISEHVIAVIGNNVSQHHRYLSTYDAILDKFSPTT